MNDNLLLLTDSYKVSHAHQYPPGTQYVYSYFESRGGEFAATCFFGLQYLLRRYLSRPITRDNIGEAAAYYRQHFGSDRIFNRAGWEHVLQHHDGFLPVRICAVPEGSVVPTGNVLMTVENLDPACWWLTNWIETLLVQLWYPTTVATVSRAMGETIREGLVRSGTPEDLPFKLHDFGCRGSTSMESAAIGGAAHLVHFRGTDTVPALQAVNDFYLGGVAGVSIPAAEHSTITSWRRYGELDAYRNMLQQFPTGLVAVVSDSWDIYAACKHLWGEELRDAVLKRDGTVIIRPDSGEPTVVLLRLLDILARQFGSTTNQKGYRVLPEQVRLIQGDGIDRRSLPGILTAVMKHGYSIDNLAFGCGGGLLQDCNRDTCQFAFKASCVTVDGEERDVYKDPIGMPSKRSKRGRLKLVRTDNGYETVRADGQEDELVEVFGSNGFMQLDEFDAVRRRAAESSVSVLAT